MPRTINLALYSADPPALDAFYGFDPESYTGFSAIADGLTHIDLEGRICPALATAWEWRSPTELDFELRQGVHFHNGQPFDADDVVATFRCHLDPATASVTRSAVLSDLVACDRLDQYRVRLTLSVPDRSFFDHLHVSSAIYPRGVLDRPDGVTAIHSHPIGTGPYRLRTWDRGRRILLQSFLGHFRGPPQVDNIRVPILPQKRWISLLASSRLDVALNLDPVGAEQAERAGLHVVSRPAALSQWFLLRNHGPLADRRVRRALNLALNRHVLATVAEGGRARPKAAVATPEQPGFCPDLAPYPYDPEQARRLLAEAGFGGGLRLRGLCSDASISLFLFVREFLGRVGVEMEAAFLPRSRWIERICHDRLRGVPFEDDFAVFHCDNPTLRPLFEHHTLLSSAGHFSLTSHPGHDALLRRTREAQDEAALLAGVRELERHAQEEGLLLTTTQLHALGAARPGFGLALGKNGHFDTAGYLALSAPDSHSPERSLPLAAPGRGTVADLSRLISGSNHLGVFYLEQMLPPGPEAHLWENLLLAQDRWYTQMLPMVREIIDQLDARINLRNVLSSIRQIGILGLGEDGRRLFVNEGFAAMFPGVDPAAVPLYTLAGSENWAALRARTRCGDAFAGPVTVTLPEALPRALFLNLTPALDESAALIGHTLVYSDLSVEQERIRQKALHDILDHVTAGLFVVDRELVVQPQFSRSCLRLFQTDDLVGRRFVDLIPGLAKERAREFAMHMDQVFADILPPELSLAQAQQRFAIGERVLHIEGRAMRDEAGAVTGVLFTVSDMTELEQARGQEQHHQLLIDLMRNRGGFRAFVRETFAALDQAEEQLARGQQAQCRQALHTIKGNAGAHGLRGLMEVVHQIEEHAEVSAKDLTLITGELRRFLLENRAVLDINPEALSDEASLVTEAQLGELAVLFSQLPVQQRRAGARWLGQVHARPARNYLPPVEQMVQRIAARQGKHVRLVTKGLDTPVDPARMGPVLQAVTHLLRNSVDHGLEPPEERQRRDKPPCGTLRLEISSTPLGYRVLVQDDGRGIDEDALVRRAIALSRLSAKEAERLNRAGRLALMFEDGLSTAAETTDISGRGTGMSAIRSVVEKRGGTLDIENAPGWGVRFSIFVPTPDPAAHFPGG